LDVLEKQHQNSSTSSCFVWDEPGYVLKLLARSFMIFFPFCGVNMLKQPIPNQKKQMGHSEIMTPKNRVNHDESTPIGPKYMLSSPTSIIIIIIIHHGFCRMFKD
jgi:hypothetical protein